jgi:DNA (cytosine-5)-methyltransferase 1
MTRLTCGSFFSGCGGSDMGARAAGFTPIFGVEYDPRVAEVYRANVGDHVIVGDVRTVDLHALPSVDFFMASPPCQGHSNARDHKRMGQRDDLDFSGEILGYVALHRPRFVMVENVVQYTKSPAARRIVETLRALGYDVTVNHVDMANYGVPTSRRRSIILAVKTGNAPYLSSFARKTRTRWGDYTNVTELRGLPLDKLYPSQARRADQFEEVDSFPAIVDGQNTGRQNWTVRGCTEPMFTVTATCWKAMPKIVMDREGKEVRRISTTLLATLAGFFHDFIVPTDRKLACHVIGNAVPPRFVETVALLLVALNGR